MAANLNLRATVKAGELTVARAKQLLCENAGPDAMKTVTWRWLCRVEAASVLVGRAL